GGADGRGGVAGGGGGRVCAAGWNPAKLRIPDHRRRGAAMAQIEGRCEPRFEAVRGALAQNLDSGEELGASLVVDIDGDNVVDLWGGFCDEARTVPWTERTITNVWSSTKTVTSLAALMLADRGELDVDAPVARYWPEFAPASNAGPLVRPAIPHSSRPSPLEHP